MNVSVSDAGVGEHHGHRLIAGNRVINSHYPLIIVQALEPSFVQELMFQQGLHYSKYFAKR